MPTSDPERWKLSDLKDILDCSAEIPDDNSIIETLRGIDKILEEEMNSNFILGKVIIENDLLDGDENADDD